jgi:diacylglycerol kinase
MKKFSFTERFKSFKYAFKGISVLFSEEHNSRVHLFFMLLAIVFGFAYRISAGEWLMLILLFAFVFVCEIFNSAIENLCDLISKEHHPAIGKIKDLSAAAVLLASLAAFISGLIIFIPKVF